MDDKRYAGVMISEAPFINLPVLFAGCGLDFIIIDGEHGGFDYSTLSGMLMNARLAGVTAIVRLPDNQRRDITRLMDMGADGLLLPMTNSAEDIQHVVEYAKYTPLGRRGISTTRAHTFYNPPALEIYMREANDRTLIFAQIETAEGVNAVREILSVEGVSGAFVGPNDLSCDLNCVGQDAPVIDAMQKVTDAAKATGKKCGVITGKKTLLEAAAGMVMTWFSVGSELNMLKSGCQAVVGRIRDLGGSFNG